MYRSQDSLLESDSREILEFRVTPSYMRCRLDKFLVDMVPSWISRTMIQKAIKESKVLVDACQKKPAYLLQLDDVVSIEVPAPAVTEVLPEEIPLSILHEDEDILVVNKPPGMIVHPVPHKTSGTLVNALLYHCRDFQREEQDLRPGIVHRLDKDTSGVMVVAKHIRAHHHLSNQFRYRKNRKEYLALIKGNLPQQEGMIDTPLTRNPQNRMKMIVHDQGKEAYTYWKVLLELGELATLVLVQIKTGRMHQIRVHFKSLHHPVVGDILYGDLSDQQELGAARQMLHALRLGLFHPRTNQWAEYVAPLPQDFRSVLSTLYRQQTH